MRESKTIPNEKTRRAGALAVLTACLAGLLLAILVLVLGVKVHRRDAQLANAQKQLAEVKSDDAKVKGELDKATSESGDLKAQLDKAKSQSGALQAQVEQAKSAAADLQTQADKSKAQTADIQARLDKSKTQSADLQDQLNQATAGSTQLLTQLDQAKIQSMDMQARLQKAEADISQLQPMLLKTRHMPVTTSFEKEHWGRGITLHVNNLTQQPLGVDITVNSRGNPPRAQAHVIGPAGTLNIDKLLAGDSVVVSSDGYDTLNLTAQ
jgi:septal ring factor EnvC (AmiA/AmiB activator)